MMVGDLVVAPIGYTIAKDAAPTSARHSLGYGVASYGLFAAAKEVLSGED